jgi:polyphosphate kinase
MNPYIHRDISWLDFNYRVLQEARDKSVPLYERIKFLAIYSSNLDEFFRVRVAGHRNLVRMGKKAQKELNYEPSEVLDQILTIVNNQQEEFSVIFEKQIVPELAKYNVTIVRRHSLNKEQTEFIETYFNDLVLPHVQPIVLMGKKVKPFLNNGALYLALNLKDKETQQSEYAIVKVPSDFVPRFLVLPSKKQSQHEVILLGDLVRHNISSIFPGYDIIDTYSIKLTRDAELYLEEDEDSADFIKKLRNSLLKRNVGPASRLVYDRTMPKKMLEYFMNVFELSSYDLLPEGRYHNNSDFFKFPDFGLTNLKDPVLPPLSISELEDADNIFDRIAEKDYLIHLPYQSYESVIKFFEDAAVDPAVTHIKIIQYRVASQSRIMEALKKAVKNGKQVSAFVELKARFDEEANLKWGEFLEKSGVSVFYSMPGIKVHSKLSMIRRIEEGAPKLYAYYSTGNFHEGTAKVYSDIGIFTANQKLNSEAARIFSYLETKQLPSKNFDLLGVGTFNLKEKFIDLIKREISNAQNGKSASCILKMNTLEDKEMIDLLYEASKSGVKVQLIIRGACSLVPGIKGFSSNITAISIVDRYLEHARIFSFENGGKQEIYFSSADWMVRNLHHRIETLVPVLQPDMVKTVNTLLKIQLNDNIKARFIDVKKNNQYVKTDADLAVRSQIETYYYLKRQMEYQNLLKQKEQNQ